MSYVIQEPGDNSIAREVFLRKVLTDMDRPHLWMEVFRTDVTPGAFLQLHSAWKDVLTVDAYGDKSRVVQVTAPGDPMLHVSEPSSGYLRVAAAAVSEEAVNAYAEWLRPQIPLTEEAEPRDDGVYLSYLYRDGFGAPHTSTRHIDAPDWEDIARNYSKGAAAQLEDLAGLDLDSVSGKVGVLTGPPGSGKTTFLRALMRAWRRQATFTYVMDPKALFGDANFMMHALLSRREDSKWAVMILEDAEQYIAPDAKKEVGEALSNLLNLGDGLLGQGMKIVFLFTSNKPMEALHPAVVRRGRRFAQVDVPLLTAAEASEWLGSPVEGDTALADLFAMREGEGAAG